MFMRDALQAQARRAIGLALVSILCLSSWICLIAGCIAIMSPALGWGGAFLVMAAVLAAAALLVVVISRLSAKSPKKPEIEAGEARLIAAAANAALSSLQNKKTLRLALIATSAIAAALALVLSGGDAQDKD